MEKKIDAVELEQISRKYALAATGEMIAIPLPGLDLAAVFVTWAKMIQDIGKRYGRDLSMNDARALAWTFLRTALSAGGAWFGSAAIAKTILKVFPLGKIGAYFLDATVAGTSMARLTRSLAKSAQVYFESDPVEKQADKRGLDQILDEVVIAGTAVAGIVRGIKDI